MNDWIWPVLSYMSTGLVTTLWLAVSSLLIATTVGILLGALSRSPLRAVRGFVSVYVDVFRGIPSLLILLFVFFALPEIGIRTSAFAACIIGLGLWGSANIAEVARGAIQSVPSGQTEAASALGMGGVRTFIWVILPQAMRRFLPPYIGQATTIIQATALTSIVGVADLQGTARQMIERLAYTMGDGHALEIYGIVLLVFFAICYPLTLIASRMERRLHV